MCVRVIGDKSGLDEDIRSRIAQLEESTKDNDGLHFQIALNYGGRDEIIPWHSLAFRPSAVSIQNNRHMLRHYKLFFS